MRIGGELRAESRFEKNVFYESEVARRLETFGNIAHAFSTYESRHAPGENSWKVMTILWDSERPDNPIPEKYLSGAQITPFGIAL
jgi:hypothetical protein